MAEDRDSPSLEYVEAVVELLDDADVATVDPATLLSFFRAMIERLHQGGADEGLEPHVSVAKRRLRIEFAFVAVLM